MKSFNKLVTLTLSCMMLIVLTACSDQSVATAKTVVGGMFQSAYQGKYTESFLSLTNQTKEQVVNSWALNVEAEANYILDAFTIYGQYDTMAPKSLMNSLYSIFGKLSVEVGEPTKNDDGSYKVPLTFTPILMGESLGNAAINKVSELSSDYDDIFNLRSNEQMTVDTILADALEAELKAFESNIVWGDEMTMYVTALYTKNGSQEVWDLDYNEYFAFIEEIINYDFE